MTDNELHRIKLAFEVVTLFQGYQEASLSNSDLKILMAAKRVIAQFLDVNLDPNAIA